MARGSPRWHLPKAYSSSKGLCGARSAPRLQTVMCVNICFSCSTLWDCAFIETVQSMQSHQETARNKRPNIADIILLLLPKAHQAPYLKDPTPGCILRVS